MKILILGVNGFIGSSLTARILEDPALSEWEIYGLDLSSDKITEFLTHPRFHFSEGDMSIYKEWVTYHIRKCDVILPLVAIANPSLYVQNPLGVFELDFVANLEVVRQVAHFNRRLIFPSTSEVYGMCEDSEFDEETSNLVLGPIPKERWIYSASKQLLDRVIYALGHSKGLDFTLFRPFNWIGPKMDRLSADKVNAGRVVTQFLSCILHGQPINLVDGGTQRRCFTDIDDAVEGLVLILKNQGRVASGKIYNIGNPHNDFSIQQLAFKIREIAQEFPVLAQQAHDAKIVEIHPHDHYGKGYQDVLSRVPSIKAIERDLGWCPHIGLDESLRRILSYHARKLEGFSQCSKINE